VLGQFLLVSLLVERFIAVGAKLSTPKALDFAEDALDPPVDPWQSWTKTQLVAAAAVGFAICYLYKLDLFSSLFGPLRFDAELIGYFLTAIVIAGGSTAIQKILSAASAGAKALKSESLARIAESRARIKGVR
jgi:hypothetical protein